MGLASASTHPKPLCFASVDSPPHNYHALHTKTNTRSFWNRLQSKFGSIFYVRENGEDQAIIAAVNTVDQCLRMGYCVVRAVCTWAWFIIDQSG